MTDVMHLLDLLSKNDVVLKGFLDYEKGLEVLGHSVKIARSMRDADPVNCEPLFTTTMSALFLKIVIRLDDLKRKHKDQAELYNKLANIFSEHKNELAKSFPIEAARVSRQTPKTKDEAAESEESHNKISFKR